MEQFDAYFRRADLDGDGRISGAEAVAFFQGSSLPKHVLAQVWMHADPAGTGFLGRAEFYNALKLVTVAQSKRELTPDIVKAALYGPAAAKIPAPQINLAAIPSPQPNQMTTTPAPQMGAVAPTASQNLGFRGQTLPNHSTNQQYFPSQQNQFMRPPQPMPAGSASRPPQNLAGPELNRGGNMVGPGVPNSNISSDWLSGRTAGAPTGPLSQVPNRGITPSMPPPTTKPLDLASTPKAPVVSGNGFASDPVFGGNVFSATPTQQKRDSSGLTYSVSSSPASSVALSPAPTGSPSLSKPSSLDSLQSAFTMGPAGGQIQRAQSAGNLNQPAPPQSTSPLSSSGVSVGVGNSASNQSQLPWPRMTPSDVQKYTKVFIEVDSDRDGKITGEQARNLFLSWRLPREVLKQVWDLSDQDSDSMLSLREFCTALYLMERYREGRPLPAVLPSNILFDETLFPMMGQQASFGNAARPPTPGLSHQHGIPGVRQMTTAPGLGPPIQVALQGDGAMQPNQQKISGLVSEDVFGNQLSNGEKNGLNLTHQDVTDSEKKVEATENVILDSKEKIELYRTKMQELVLYKSRCDNRLNEITERASSDKREAEFVTKKYEEKYKQVAEIASKLAMEDARFRDLQGRKNELHQAIIKMEQGGSKGDRGVRVIIVVALFILISNSTSKITAKAHLRANMAGQGQEGGWNFRYGGDSSRDGSWEYRWGSGSGPGGASWGFGGGSGRSGGGGGGGGGSGPGGFGFGWGGSSSGEGGTGNFGFYGGNFGFGPFGGGGANFNGGFGFGGGGNPTGQPGGHGVGGMNNGNNPGNRAGGSRS